MYNRKELTKELFSKISKEDRESLKERWEKETKRRAHLVSMNSIVLKAFHYDLLKIVAWVRKLGFAGLEVRFQDLFGFTGKLDAAKIKILKEKDIVLGFHMSDWAHWTAMWNNETSSIENLFGSQKEARAYFGGIGRKTILERWREELELGHYLKSQYFIFHAHEVDLNSFFTHTFYHTDKEVIQTTKEALSALDVPNVAIENGNTFSSGVRRLADFDRLSSRNIVIDTAHLESVVMEETYAQGYESFENIFTSEVSEWARTNRARIIHLSDSYFTNQHTKPRINWRPLSFFEKRRLASRDNRFFDHLPVGTNALHMKKLINILNPKFVVHELKVEPLEILEKAYIVQKHHLTKDA